MKVLHFECVLSDSVVTIVCLGMVLIRCKISAGADAPTYRDAGDCDLESSVWASK